MSDIKQQARDLFAQQYKHDGRKAKAICIGHKSLTEADHRALRAIEAALRTTDAGGRDACAWSLHDDDNMPGTWESSCGELWTFTEGGPVENNAKFCHCCGSPIQIAAIAQREGS